MVEAGVAAAEVGARAEPAAPAGHDDGPHLRVGVDLVERRAELALHPHREGVQPVGAVEGDGGDVVGHLVGDLLVGVGHGSGP